MVTNAI